MCIATLLDRYTNTPALIAQNRIFTYKEIYKEMNAITKTINIPNNSVVGLIGDYSYYFIATLFALIIKKCTIAPILPKNIDFNMSDFGVQYLYNTDSKELQKNIKKKQYKILNHLKAINASGLILFSSGSTGAPKAIVHNFDTMIELYHTKKHNPTKTLGIFLPDHIAGIDVILSVFSTGGSLIIPKSRNPKDILEAIQTYKAEILPASPTLLRLLMLSEMEKYDLSSLKLIVYGSEKMEANLLQSLQKILPNVRFKQSFGTSETNAIKTKDHDTKEGYFKFINCDYKIINNELYLKSKTQTLGYLNSDNSVFDDEGYFATGDLVEVIESNGEQYLKIIGRSKEIINVGGEKVIPSEVEGVILNLPYILDCLVYGEKNNITGQSVGVKVVLDSRDIETKDLNNATLKKQIRIHCKDKLANYKIPTKVEIVESLAISERFKKMRNITSLKESI